MTRTLTLILVAALVALPLTGCIQNMDDLKDRLQRSAATDEGDPVTNVTDGNVTDNVTLPQWKPPVARVTVFAENGALAYKADFEAANRTEPVIVDAGNVSLVGGDSEVLEANTSISKFEWIVNGESFEGRQVTVPMTEPGIYMIVLKVTDSKGSTDEQMVHIGIMPQPFTVVHELQGGAVAGADVASGDAGTEETLTFPVVAEQDGRTLTVQEIKVTARAGATADPILYVTNPDGETTREDSSGLASSESLTFAGGAAGEWGVTLRMYAGATDAWTAVVEVTYVEEVPGLSGDGHAHGH